MRATAATILLLVLLAGAAPADAAPAWLPAERPDPTDSGRNVTIAVGPDGTAVAAWLRSGGSVLAIVEAAIRPPGGTWGPPRRLSPLDRVAWDQPAAGVDAAGNVTVVFDWMDQGAARVTVQAVRAASGATTFGPAQTLSDVSRSSDSVALDVGSGGTTVATWLERTGGASRVMSAVRDPGDGDFDARQPISEEGVVIDPATVAVDAAGGAVAVWSMVYDDINSFKEIQSASRPRGAGFPTTGVEISDTSGGIADAYDPDVAITPDGRATAVWTFNDSDGDRIQTRRRSAAGAWLGTPARASRIGLPATSPAVEVDATDTALGAWTVQESGTFATETAIRPPGASQGFGDYENPGNESSESYLPSIAMNDAGDALVSWIDFADQRAPVLGAYRPRGGVLGPDLEIAIGPPGVNHYPYGVNAGVDDQGNVAAAWTEEDATTLARPRVRVYDVAPPALTAQVPGGGLLGAPIAMRASASDRWSAPRIDWSFGDGASAAGGAVAHAFGSAGAFNVTVRARDGAQNATTLVRAVAVTVPPPPAATPRVTSSVSTQWGRRGRTFLLIRMTVRRPPAGAKAQLRCKGPKCPFKKRSTSRVRNESINVIRGMKRAKRLLRAGQRLELRITAPGHIGKVLRYPLKRGKAPKSKELCLPLGATTPSRTCG